MIIDNPESLKEWLTACLEPKCDADPAALARYVMALVKKDRPEKELKDNCLDQLDVFLQKETKPFVDLLFETLNNKSYIRPNTTSIASVTANPTNVITSSESAANSNTAVVNSTTTVNGSSACLGSSGGRNSSGGRTPQSSASVPSSTSFKGDTKKKEGFTSETEGRERRHRSRSRSRSGSRSPAGRTANRTRSHSRETDERRGRRFSDDDRRRRIPPSRRFENRYRDFRDRRVQDTSNRDRSRERDREREREREARSVRERSGRDRTVPNERDRSRSRSRSASWNRNRSRSRSGTWSRSPSRSRSRSRSRSWSRPRERSRERNRTEGHDSRNLGDPSQLTVDHGDTDYRLATGTTATPASLVTTTTTTSAAVTESVPTLTPSVTLAQPTTVENQFSAKTAKRCRDYDEMGYCMRGDLCPYDHGNDPVVVEDVSVLGFAPNAAAAPPVTQVSASSISSNTMHHIMPPIMGQSSPRPPLPAHPPPPPPPQPPQPEPYIPEPYNPEAPGLDRPTRVQPPFWTPSGPPPRPPSVRSSGPRGPHPPPPLSSVFHPNHPPRTRELIGVPTVDDARDLNTGSAKVSNNGRMVIEPHRPVMTMSGSQTNTTPSNTGLISSVGPQHLNHANHTNDIGMKRRPFDYSRLGPKKQMNVSNDRCTLELRKVPRHLNTIAELNSHFSKFGTIVNLQVCYEGDPEAALLQFSSHVEANSAYRSTEAVLNNRFVKMFWHNKDNNNSTNQKQRPAPPVEEQSENGDSSIVKPSIKDRLSLQVNVAKTNPTPNANQVTTSSSTEETTERTVIYSPIGNLSRTVFNPAVLKKTNVPSSVIPRKTKEEHKKDNLKKKMEVQKKRQQLVQMHVQHQKLLVEKLEKCKNEKEKSDIKQTVHSLAKTIADLQSDIRKEAAEISQLSSATNHRTPRTKAEAEKELLDAEMDLYNKQHRGDDTTELRQKVLELRFQARALGLLDGSGRGRGMKSRRTISTARGRGRGVVHHKLTSVDHRPRKIVVKGLNEEEKDMILPHFLQFAEVENVDHNASGTVVAFKTRRDAELAISHGSKFNNRVLALTWYKEHSTATGDAVSDLEGLVDDLTVDEEHHQPLLEVEEDILLADDEEEEDSEARSWRR